MLTKKILSATIVSIDAQLFRIVEQWQCGICFDTSLQPILPKNSQCTNVFDVHCLQNLLKVSNLHPFTREPILPNEVVIIPRNFSMTNRTMSHFKIGKDMQISQLRKLLNAYPFHKSYILSQVKQKFSLVETLFLDPSLKNDTEFMRQLAHDFFSKALDLLVQYKSSEDVTDGLMTIVKDLIRCRFFDLAKEGIKLIKRFPPAECDTFLFDLSILQSQAGLADEAYETFKTALSRLPKVHQCTRLDKISNSLLSLIENKSILDGTAHSLLSKTKLILSDWDDKINVLHHIYTTDAIINFLKCELFLDGYESLKPNLSQFKNPLFIANNKTSHLILEAIAEMEFLAKDYESAEKTLEIIRIHAETRSDFVKSLMILKKLYLFYKKLNRPISAKYIQDLIKEKCTLIKQFYSNNSFYTTLCKSKNSQSKLTDSYILMATILLNSDLRVDAELMVNEALELLKATDQKSSQFSKNLNSILFFKLYYLDAQEEIFRYHPLLEESDKMDIMNHLAMKFIENGQLKKALELIELYNPLQDDYDWIWRIQVYEHLIPYYQEKEMLLEQLFTIYSQSKESIIAVSLSSLATHIALKADPPLANEPSWAIK